MALDATNTLSQEKAQNVVFIHSDDLVTLCDKLPRVSGRVRLKFSALFFVLGALCRSSMRQGEPPESYVVFERLRVCSRPLRQWNTYIISPLNTSFSPGKLDTFSNRCLRSLQEVEVRNDHYSCEKNTLDGVARGKNQFSTERIHFYSLYSFELLDWQR